MWLRPFSLPILTAAAVISLTDPSNAEDRKFGAIVKLMTYLSSIGGDDRSGEIVAFMIAYQNLADRAANLDRALHPSARNQQSGKATTVPANDTALMWAVMASKLKADRSQAGNLKLTEALSPSNNQQSGSSGKLQRDMAAAAGAAAQAKQTISQAKRSNSGSDKENLQGRMGAAAGAAAQAKQTISQAQQSNSDSDTEKLKRKMEAAAAAAGQAKQPGQKPIQGNSDGGSGKRDNGSASAPNPCGGLVQSDIALALPWWNGSATELWHIWTQAELEAAARAKEKQLFQRRLKSAQKLLARLQKEQADINKQIAAKEAEIGAAAFRCAAAVQAAQQALQAQQASSGGFFGVLGMVVGGIATAIGGPIATEIIKAATQGTVGHIVQAIIWGNIDMIRQFPDCLDVINLQAELESLKQDLAAYQAAIQTVMVTINKLTNDEQAAAKIFALKQWFPNPTQQFKDSGKVSQTPPQIAGTAASSLQMRPALRADVQEQPCGDLNASRQHELSFDAMMTYVTLANPDRAHGGFDQVKLGPTILPPKKLSIRDRRTPSKRSTTLSTINGGGFNKAEPGSSDGKKTKVTVRPCGTLRNPCNKPRSTVIGPGLLENNGGFARQGPAAIGSPLGGTHGFATTRRGSQQ